LQGACGVDEAYCDVDGDDDVKVVVEEAAEGVAAMKMTTKMGLQMKKKKKKKTGDWL